MNVIVTNNAIEYIGFLKVNKLCDVEKIVGDVDCLVYHKSNESVEDKVSYLTKYKEKIKKIIYIRNREDYDKTIKMLVVGSGGKFLDDEFFLENSQELSNLIANIDEVTAIAELSGVNAVGDFFNRYLKDGSSGFNKEYLKVVKKAVTNMMSDYKKKDLELLQMSETATELFAHTASILSKVEEEKDKLKESVKLLQENKDSIINTVSPVKSNILFFPTISYLKEKDIIRVKEIGNFNMLTSFIMGLSLYLKDVKYLKPKLIFIMPVGEMYFNMYKDYNWVTQENYNTMQGYYSDIVFTNYPVKDVLVRLLEDSEYDTYIIVDRLKFSEKFILNCKGDVKYAISSTKLADLYNLKKISSFYSTGVEDGLFSVNYTKNYPDKVEQRERFYLREYSYAYENFCSQLKG